MGVADWLWSHFGGVWRGFRISSLVSLHVTTVEGRRTTKREARRSLNTITVSNIK